MNYKQQNKKRKIFAALFTIVATKRLRLIVV